MAGQRRHDARYFTLTPLRLKRSPLNLYILTILLSSVIWRATGQSYPMFQIPYSNSVFQNQFLDHSNGNLFIGGLNYIYKLNSDLDLIRSEQTGPVDDNPDCRPPPQKCDFPFSTDNYNKVILVHEGRLITCGSIYQGTCRIRDLGNLNVTYGDSIREVVPNTPTGSAVGFIANGDNDRVLYVASSYGDWLRDVPTVSTRLISQSTSENKLFKISSESAEIEIPPIVRDASPAEQPFNISYIYGFTSGQFSYFAASQPRDYTTISRYTSKLVRLCHGDPDFNSYIELHIVCGINDDESDYNLIQSAYLASLSLDGGESKDILVAAFSKSDIYSVDDINQAFYNRRLDCAEQGTDNTQIRWAGSRACNSNSFLFNFINDSSPTDYCHTIENQAPLGGDDRAIIISATPVYESTDHITAVAAVQHFETSIIFSGDSNGNFKKLRLDTSTSADVYKSINLHQTPVIRNGLLVSQDKEFIFITSEDEITKVPIEECQQYRTCGECHSARDPFCGWCSLQTECTRRIDSHCQGSQNGSSSRWLSNEDDCLTITAVTPVFALAEAITELTIYVSNLPSISNSSLTCVFLEGTVILGSQPATIMEDMLRVTCNTPVNIRATSEGFKTVELQLHYEESGQKRNIVAIPFDLYDCTTISSCSECAGNKYGCQWCLHSNQCNDGTQGCVMSDIITSSNVCPLIRKADEVLIPAGQTQELQFDGVNFPNNQMFNFSCQVQFPGLGRLIIPALVINNQIRCEANLYNYPSSSESISGSLEILWGNLPLDMEDKLIVTIYKCSRMAVTMLDGESRPTCGMCFSSDTKYGCNWCLPLNDCLSLLSHLACPQDEWLSQDMNCPNPTIISLFPTSGHVAGGTRITIRGYNLGLNASDIKLISVGDAYCASTEFVSSQLLYCTTDLTTIRQGKVIVEFNSSRILLAESEQEFSFVKPTILSSYPVRGPRSGGTRLVVRGIHLDAGLNRAVTISSTPCYSRSGYSCDIFEEYSDEIICRNSAGNVNVTEGHEIYVDFDLGCETGGGGFTYQEDPVVHAFVKLRSFASGGLDLKISGEYFDIIQEARLEFVIGPNTFTGECFNSSGSKMELICKSPNIYDAQTDYPFLLPSLNISLYMDGVTRYIHLDSFPGSLDPFFVFVKDPVYYQLPGGEDIIKVPYEGQGLDNITLQGDGLTLASTRNDVSVTIGVETCRVLELSLEHLICQYPSLPKGTHQVQVEHGNLIINVGSVEYLRLDDSLSLQSVAIIILSCVLVVVFGCLCIFITVCCRNVTNKPTNRQSVLHSYYDNNSQKILMKTRIDEDNISDHTYYGEDMDYLSINSTDPPTNMQPPTLPGRNETSEIFQLKSNDSKNFGKSSDGDKTTEIAEEQLPALPKRESASMEIIKYSDHIYNGDDESNGIAQPKSQVESDIIKSSDQNKCRPLSTVQPKEEQQPPTLSDRQSAEAEIIQYSAHIYNDNESTETAQSKPEVPKNIKKSSNEDKCRSLSTVESNEEHTERDDEREVTPQYSIRIYNNDDVMSTTPEHNLTEDEVVNNSEKTEEGDDPYSHQII